MISQENAILEYLKQGNSLTPLDALEKFGTMRVGARVYDLKRKGYNIISDTGYYGKKRFARYSLSKDSRYRVSKD